ncbi:MAG TPA: YobA family protein, partial [Candidatus Mediterraneibacter avicola]|nr:YobA family protein [Candidatus Mediterraneibacter avicola]
MRKNRKIIAAVGIVLLILIIIMAAAAIRNHFMKDAPSDRGKADAGQYLKAVYLEKEDGNSIFVNLTAEYPFTGTIPEGELYDEEGKKITEQDLNNGDVVNIYGNGIMAESYPAQYHGITKIERTEQANQKYIQEYGHYLDELFIEKDPAQLPYLNVCYSDELASAAVMIPEAFSYTWTYEENGESRTITT